ncbi:Putative neutral zinc metallopeptidase [Corynebacterium capitovis DSM 44611]|uniref:KPN_02809 family neutral zinc metallopeptidase n=1 Tax=Corynebacterium capitovis TaxID=131081 RepID=UPI0003751910|nr:neutral zinc metallopeptidase [Corynebacterium capitovis]WKD57571.1 Putative neutral zinc metallopeptidase [Corynebacterium capitovis DSM 44611]
MTFKNSFSQGGGGRVTTSSGGGGGLPIVVGGGGIGTLVILALVYFLGGGTGTESLPSAGHSSNPGSYNLDHCQSEGAANEYDDCRVEATMYSVDAVWQAVLPQQAGIEYTQPGMHLFENSVATGCGNASASTGPFYCPSDTTAYLDVSFFQQLGQLGGSNGPLAQEYAIAHEIGHHIQNLEGTLGLSDYNNPGEDSAAVAIELQADCYAGLWAKRASEGEDAMLEPISRKQLSEALQTARAIGDDNIQKRSGGQINPDAWTHGSSEQREDAFMAGYESGVMSSCDFLHRGGYSS